MAKITVAKKIKKTFFSEKDDAYTKEQKTLWLSELTPEDIPRDLYYALKDDWKKNLRIDELFAGSEEDTGMLKYVPIGNIVLTIIILLVIIAK